MSCIGCTETRQGVAAVLADAQASLTRSRVYLRPTVRPEPRQVVAMRHRLAGLFEEHHQIHARLGQPQPGLGLLPVMLPVIAGASALVTMIGAWAWKHREQAREVELRSELYARMLEEGLSPERAAALAMGAESPLSQVLAKLTVLSVVGVGIYLAYKLLK